MNLSRRDLALLLPATLVPAVAAAQTPAPSDSQTFRNEDITPTRNGPLVARQMVRTNTRTGYRVDLHESELPVGEAPHAPHRHVHEEMLMIRDGLLDVTIAGKSTRVGPGSAVYFATNQEHGWRNVGTVTARYFVLALGDDNV